jgi:uncharacterized protein YeaO (DUF488 family)
MFNVWIFRRAICKSLLLTRLVTNSFLSKNSNLYISSRLIIKIERIYDNPKGGESYRILVDRLWPRGLSKDKVRVDLWQKDVAPSNTLRKWFGHDEKKWDEFKHKYFKELDKNNDAVNTIIKTAQKQNSITLVYGTKEKRFNNAVALKEYLEEKIKK